MPKRPLRRSSEYRAKEAETLTFENNLAGTDAPYLLADHHVVLKELFFNPGPASYCLIYEVTDEYVGLSSLCHGVGSRKSGTLRRVWRHS